MQQTGLKIIFKEWNQFQRRKHVGNVYTDLVTMESARNQINELADQEAWHGDCMVKNAGVGDRLHQSLRGAVYMIKVLSIAAVALMATQASAVTKVVPLGAIIVPPTQTTSQGLSFDTVGDNSGYYEFTISQPNTVGVSSFTNSAVSGKTGVFDFTSIGLYSGLGTSGTLLASGTIVPRSSGTMTASLDPYMFTAGNTYTIAYTGTVKGAPSSVGSSITFALGTVPEPASWALMIVGFGMVGYSARRRTAVVTA